MSRDEELREVVRLERQLLDPSFRASERVEQLLDPDFVEFGASGRAWDRASIVAELRAAPDVPGEPMDFTAVPLAHGVVLLTYRVAGPGASLRSSVWIRYPIVGWRLRFHQGTSVRAKE